MRQLLAVVLLLSTLHVLGQQPDAVTLTVSGTGHTKELAQRNALRSAIEQSFGAFISSKTEVLNDTLIVDQVVSISNGNIQNFEIISELQLPDNTWASTLKATVSVSKLTKYFEGKGVALEFNGSMFGMNIRLQKLNEEAELVAINNLCEASMKILPYTFDDSLEIGTPKVYKKRLDYDFVSHRINGKNFHDLYSNYFPEGEDNYSIEFKVKISLNKTMKEWSGFFYNNIKSISMTKSEIETYGALNKPTNKVAFGDIVYHLRNQKSLEKLYDFIVNAQGYLSDFIVFSEVDTLQVNKVGLLNFDLLRHNSKNDNKSWDYPPYSLIEAGACSGDETRDGIACTQSSAIATYFIKLKTSQGWDVHSNEWRGLTVDNMRVINITLYGESGVLGYFIYNHIIPLQKLEKVKSYNLIKKKNY